MTTSRQTISQFYNASKRCGIQFYIALLNPLSSIALGVGLPYFASLSIASVLNQDGNFTTNISLLIFVSVIGLVFNRAGFLALNKIIAKTMFYLGEKIFERLLMRGVRFHVNNISGKLVSDVFDYLQAYLNITLVTFTNGSSFVISLIIGLMVLLTQSWQLAAFVFILVLVVGYATYQDSIRRSALRTVRLKAQKDLISHYSDSIVNAPTVKIFSKEQEEIQHHLQLSKRLENLRLNDWIRAGKNGNYRIGMLLIGIIGLLLLINYLADSNPEKLGVGIFAFTYTFTLLLRLFEITNISRGIEEGLLNAGPITEMLNEDIEVKDAPNASSIDVTRGEILFKNVSFHYEDSDENDKIFENFNLHIKPGERIGLVGPSGGGKTTLTRIVLRFEDIQAGEILVDSQNISQVTQHSLRQSIGYVPQEPLLFHRTILENISYGNPLAKTNEVIEATKKAQAFDFIDKLPNKLDTYVGERGVKLSGGQRQRVAIARVLLKNAPILVLDEATSALDSESEVAVQKALDELMKGKTTIVIAHRLSTIQKMDRIIVLDNGRITEEGSHKDLLKKKNGQYARLWKHQSGGFLQD